MILDKIREGAIVTGGSGFIGSHMVDNLITSNIDNIVVIDNLSSGDYLNISKYVDNGRIIFHKSDLSKSYIDEKLLNGVDTIFHFAAYPEVRFFDDPSKYFEDNVRSTFNLLEAIRKSSVKYLIFSSSSTIYGKPKIFPTPEQYGPLVPISHYGSSKLACEALISSFSHTYGFSSYVFRFANVVGPRSKHGIIWDFIKKIKQDNKQLSILGDGTQSKSYIYIQDCIDAMLLSFKDLNDPVNILNIGTEDAIDVISIADLVCSNMGIDNIEYNFIKSTLDGSGWIGDVKSMNLDISKVQKLGFNPRYSSKDALSLAIKEILHSSKNI